MPTLFRLMLWCAMIAGTGYAILYVLAYGVHPTPREAYVKIPAERVNAQPSSQ
jgi:hypothetical protein